MVWLAVFVKTVAQFLVEILDAHAAGDDGLLEAFLVHPFFGLGDNGQAQMLSPIFRQHHDAPDFRGFAIDTSTSLKG